MNDNPTWTCKSFSCLVSYDPSCIGIDRSNEDGANSADDLIGATSGRERGFVAVSRTVFHYANDEPINDRVTLSLLNPFRCALGSQPPFESPGGWSILIFRPKHVR